MLLLKYTNYVPSILRHGAAIPADDGEMNEANNDNEVNEAEFWTNGYVNQKDIIKYESYLTVGHMIALVLFDYIDRMHSKKLVSHWSD